MPRAEDEQARYARMRGASLVRVEAGNGLEVFDQFQQGFTRLMPTGAIEGGFEAL